MRNGKKKSLVGDPINFRGMANAPVNEAGVVALFSMVARDLGYYVQEIGSDFPDAILRRESARGWEELAVGGRNGDAASIDTMGWRRVDLYHPKRSDRVAPGGLVYHVPNRSVAGLPLFRAVSRGEGKKAPAIKSRKPKN